MLERVRAAARGHGGSCLEKAYRPRPHKMRFRCAEGHRFDKLAGAVLYAKQWCPLCQRAPSKDFLNRLDRTVKNFGGRMTTRKVGKLTDPHTFVCARGHRFHQQPTRIVHKGWWCPVCSYEEKGERLRKTLLAAQERAKAQGGRCLSTEGGTGEDMGTWQCNEGHVWNARLKDIAQGRWCPECWAARRRRPRKTSQARKRKLTIEYCQEFAEENGGECLMREYYNYHDTSMAWRCENGHEWFSSLAAMEHRDNYCLECADEERRNTWLEEMRAFAKENGGECLSTEWLGNKEKLSWRCENGHEFERCWDIIRDPPFCADCEADERYQEEGEDRLCAIAERHGGYWIESRYKGVRARYEFECAQGHHFEATPATADRSWKKHCGCES